MVAESALRFGDRNPQQFRQLQSRLQKLDPGTVAIGLLKAFTEGEGPPGGSAVQELSGKLLAEIRPVARFDLGATLRAALPRYELSVEQFPQYLRLTFGAAPLLQELTALEESNLSDQERRSLRAMLFWLQRGQCEGGHHVA